MIVQKQKRSNEEGVASTLKSMDNHEAVVTSTPGSDKSEMTISSLNSSLKSRKFSFASPVPENKSHDTALSMNLSDKKEKEQGLDGSFAKTPEKITEEGTIDAEQDIEDARNLTKGYFQKMLDLPLGGLKNLNSFLKEAGSNKEMRMVSFKMTSKDISMH